MIFPDGVRTFELAFVAATVLFLPSCGGKSEHPTSDQDFSSLAGEYEFWRTWINHNPLPACPLEPFLLEERGTTVKKIDNELRATAKASEIFVVVIQVNVQNAIFEVVSLAKGTQWQQTRWEDLVEDGWRKTVGNAPVVKQDVLTTLSGEAVYLDASDIYAYDCDSVYVFLRYKGKCSRFAIYNPQYEDASHYHPDDDTGKKAEGDPVAAALKSLFTMIEMSDPKEIP
jgi:hypothetical protein